MIKKAIIGVLTVLLLLSGLFLYCLPSLIRKDGIKAEIVNSFKELTGLNLDIQGDIKVIGFPSPHVVINFLDVHSPPEANSPFLMEIKMLEAWPSIPALLHGKLIIRTMNIKGVDVELERMKNDQVNWSESTLLTASGSSSIRQDSIFTTSEFNISDARVRYQNALSNSVMEFNDITLNMRGSEGGERNLQLNLRYLDKPFTISGYIGELSGLVANNVVKSNLSIKTGKSSFNYEGDMGYKDAHILLKGKASAQTDDLVPLVALFYENAKKSPDHKPVPLKLNSDVTSEKDKVVFPNIAIDGAFVKGTSQAVISSNAHTDIKLMVNSFDLETMISSGLLDIKNPSEGNAGKNGAMSGTAAIPTKSVFDALTFSADVSVADAVYNDQHIKNVHFNFDEANGEINIPQANASLPGDSRIIYSGIGKQGYQGFIWEGQVDVSGSDFTKMMDLFKTKSFAFPPQDFKRFHMRANVALSDKDMRISEIAARIENVEFLGGIIATFGETTKIAAALRMGGLNLDHFIAQWGVENWISSMTQDSVAPKQEVYFAQWLKNLNYDLTLNTSLEQTTLNGILRDHIDLRLEATKNNLLFKNIKTSYNGTQLYGDVGINLSSELPKLNLDLTGDTLDVSNFFGIPPISDNAVSKQVKKDRWNQDQFDFHWIGLIDAVYHFKVDHLKYGNLQAQSVDISGDIKGHTLNISSLTGIIMGASISLTSAITGGKIPTISLGADLRNVNMDQLIYMFPGLQGITGNYNMKVSLSTNGTDTLSWISNLNGIIDLAGRDIVIHGFNMVGIISAINYVRTVADILDVVKRAWPGGNTVFSTVQGGWAVSNGTLKPTNLKLNSPYADGLVEGEVDLISWRTHSSITFFVKSLDAVHPPKMIVGYSGDLDSPERTLDTRSLEQYVTSKTSEKLLDQYGH